MTKNEQEKISLAKWKEWWSENYQLLGVSTIDSDHSVISRATWLHQNKKLVKNTNILKSNFESVAEELRMAINILFELPIEIFDDDASSFIRKYKNAHKEVMQDKVREAEKTHQCDAGCNH